MNLIILISFIGVILNQIYPLPIHLCILGKTIGISNYISNFYTSILDNLHIFILILLPLLVLYLLISNIYAFEKNKKFKFVSLRLFVTYVFKYTLVLLFVYTMSYLIIVSTTYSSYYIPWSVNICILYELGICLLFTNSIFLMFYLWIFYKEKFISSNFKNYKFYLYRCIIMILLRFILIIICPVEYQEFFYINLFLFLFPDLYNFIKEIVSYIFYDCFFTTAYAQCDDQTTWAKELAQYKLAKGVMEESTFCFKASDKVAGQKHLFDCINDNSSGFRCKEFFIKDWPLEKSVAQALVNLTHSPFTFNPDDYLYVIAQLGWLPENTYFLELKHFRTFVRCNHLTNINTKSSIQEVTVFQAASLPTEGDFCIGGISEKGGAFLTRARPVGTIPLINYNPCSAIFIKEYMVGSAIPVRVPFDPGNPKHWGRNIMVIDYNNQERTFGAYNPTFLKSAVVTTRTNSGQDTFLSGITRRSIKTNEIHDVNFKKEKYNIAVFEQYK